MNKLNVFYTLRLNSRATYKDTESFRREIVIFSVGRFNDRVRSRSQIGCQKCKVVSLKAIALASLRRAQTVPSEGR